MKNDANNLKSKEEFKKDLLNLNELVRIINLIGKTEDNDIEVNNIGIIDKVFNIRKKDVSFDNMNNEEVIIEIDCSDNRKLNIDFKSHYRNHCNDYDDDYHAVRFSYLLPNNNILKFDASLNEYFEKLHYPTLYEALEKITADDIISREYFTKEHENLIPLYLECNNNEITGSKFLSWNDLKNNTVVSKDSKSILNELKEAKFKGKELIHLTHFLGMKVDSIDETKAEEKVDQIYNNLSDKEKKLLKKKLK